MLGLMCLTTLYHFVNTIISTQDACDQKYFVGLQRRADAAEWWQDWGILA